MTRKARLEFRIFRFLKVLWQKVVAPGNSAPGPPSLPDASSTLHCKGAQVFTVDTACGPPQTAPLYHLLALKTTTLGHPLSPDVCTPTAWPALRRVDVGRRPRGPGADGSLCRVLWGHGNQSMVWKRDIGSR